MRQPLNEARRWLLQAENDLRFAELAVREGFFRGTCSIVDPRPPLPAGLLTLGFSHEVSEVPVDSCLISLPGRLQPSQDVGVQTKGHTPFPGAIELADNSVRGYFADLGNIRQIDFLVRFLCKCLKLFPFILG